MPTIRNTPFTVIVDSNEQVPWQFRTIDVADHKGMSALVVHTEVRKLKTGDYSIAGLEDRVTIERKSISDALGTFTAGRERFERELERMKEMDYGAIYIEGKPEAMARHIRSEGRRVKMKSIMGSLRAWRQRYGVHTLWCLNRHEAERECIADLRQYWNDRIEAEEVEGEIAKWKVCFD